MRLRLRCACVGQRRRRLGRTPQPAHCSAAWRLSRQFSVIVQSSRTIRGRVPVRVGSSVCSLLSGESGLLSVSRQLGRSAPHFVIPAKAGTQAVPHRNASCEVGTARLKARGSSTAACGQSEDHLGSRLRALLSGERWQPAASRQPRRCALYFVIPAQAGTQAVPKLTASSGAGTTGFEPCRADFVAHVLIGDRLGPRLRGDDEVVGVADQLAADTKKFLRTALRLRGNDEVESEAGCLTACVKHFPQAVMGLCLDDEVSPHRLPLIVRRVASRPAGAAGPGVPSWKSS
jgi:hypothetical protein